ncbi:MAG: hypothetical protein IIX13_09450 [Bacteroidales bacterium]|nr:hypothetical protein [Bacteroidales bacterium]
MNKIFLTQDGEVLRVQKRGQILLTLNAKENGNAAVAKRWEDVEDLRVTANIPNVSGIVRLPHTFDGSDMTIAAHYEWHDCNVMVIGNLGGVPFEFNIELKVDAAAAETTSAIVEVPALDAGGAGGSAGGGMVEVTHEQLKAMRDAGQLVAGQQYRITDYVATTTDPESRSANHPFDIIVTADNERTLNESARAIAHAGDTYFEKCNLAAWQLMYCLDNDTSRFAWAQEGGEFYEFSVRAFGAGGSAKLESDSDTTISGFPYRFTVNYQGSEIAILAPQKTFSTPTVCYFVGIATDPTQVYVDYITYKIQEDGKGVVYRMIDENNNDMPYDFKGIQFKRYKITRCDNIPSFVGKYGAKGIDIPYSVDSDDFRFAYLFNVMMNDLDEDDSVGFYLGIPKNCKISHAGSLPNCVCMQDMTSGESSCSDWESLFGTNWTCMNGCSGWRSNGSKWTCGDSCDKWFTENSGNWMCEGDNSYWECSAGGWAVKSHVWYFNILSFFEGVVDFIPSVNYPQFAAENTNGELKVWNPADLVQ